MNYQLDVSQEYSKSRKSLFTLSLLYSLLFTAILIADVLLIALANEEYLVNLIISVTLSIIFTWFSIYFFTNIYNDVNNKYRYFRGYESGLRPIEEVEFLKKSEELCYINGLYVYPLYVRYIQGIDKQDKVIFVTTNNLDYKNGDKLTITTYQRILIKAEIHQ